MLRRWSLDELPNLFNVVTGSLSLVGPRPLVFYELSQIPDEVRELRLRVRPGVTGLAQVNGRLDMTPEKRIELDLECVRRTALVSDTAILVKTAVVVLRHPG